VPSAQQPSGTLKPEGVPFNFNAMDMQTEGPAGVVVRAGRMFDAKAGTMLTNQIIVIKGGKIAGVTVTHSEKGNVPVKKYKSTKKMAAVTYGGLQPVSFNLAQAQSLGTVWIGYSYIDDYGDEVIYWFPYEMILDGDTGAVDYVPIY
jgi:hypothetical protein